MAMSLRNLCDIKRDIVITIERKKVSIRGHDIIRNFNLVVDKNNLLVCMKETVCKVKTKTTRLGLVFSFIWNLQDDVWIIVNLIFFLVVPYTSRGFFKQKNQLYKIIF